MKLCAFIQRFRCRECGGIFPEQDFLGAQNPFLPEEIVQGCPKCRAVDPFFERICDAYGCGSIAGIGTPTAAGYRWTCALRDPEKDKRR